MGSTKLYPLQPVLAGLFFFCPPAKNPTGRRQRAENSGSNTPRATRRKKHAFGGSPEAQHKTGSTRSTQPKNHRKKKASTGRQPEEAFLLCGGDHRRAAALSITTEARSMYRLTIIGERCPVWFMIARSLAPAEIADVTKPRRRE